MFALGFLSRFDVRIGCLVLYRAFGLRVLDLRMSRTDGTEQGSKGEPSGVQAFHMNLRLFRSREIRSTSVWMTDGEAPSFLESLAGSQGAHCRGYGSPGGEGGGGVGLA